MRAPTLMRLMAVCLFLLAAAMATAVTAADPLDPQVPGGEGEGGALPGGDPVEIVTDPSFSYGLAVGAVAVGIGAWFTFRGGAKFVTKENVLENETRSDIYEFLEDEPGTHLRGIADELDLSTTNVLWHLRKLEDADLVRSEKQGGYKLFYLVGGGMAGKREALATSVLRNDNAQLILEYVSSNPGSHQRQMARALGVNHGTVRWHLKKMLETDLLLEVRREHSIQYYLTDLGASMLGLQSGHEGVSQAGGDGGQAAA